MQLSTANPRGELVAFEGYLVDRRRWVITYRGADIPLKRKAFDLLLYLIDHRDEVVPKETLMEALWSNLIVEDSNVTQQIFLLRKALTQHESGRKIIETIPGRGYRFVPCIAYPARDSTAAGVFLNAHISRVTMTISEETEDELEQQPAPRSVERRWSGFAAVACALFALGGYGLRCWQEHSVFSTDQAFASVRDSSAASISSIGGDISHRRY